MPCALCIKTVAGVTCYAVTSVYFVVIVSRKSDLAKSDAARLNMLVKHASEPTRTDGQQVPRLQLQTHPPMPKQPATPAPVPSASFQSRANIAPALAERKTSDTPHQEPVQGGALAPTDTPAFSAVPIAAKSAGEERVAATHTRMKPAYEGRDTCGPTFPSAVFPSALDDLVSTQTGEKGIKVAHHTIPSFSLHQTRCLTRAHKDSQRYCGCETPTLLRNIAA
jgi:hypothetical protein